MTLSPPIGRRLESRPSTRCYARGVQYFIDRAGALSNLRRTATGGFVVDATLARVGILEYTVPEGVVRRYNPPEVLASALDGLATVPVTNRHPASFVTPETYRNVTAGHVLGTPRFEDGHVRATLAIQDAQLIADIERGVAREVSMGYTATNVPQSGTCDEGTYDEVRVEIHWNHIAIVPAGRAGRTVRLQLDSMDIPQGEAPMFKIDGKEVPVEAAQAAFDAATSTLEGRLAVAELALVAATDEVEKLKVELAAAKSDEAIDRAVEIRLAKQKAADEAAARLETVRKAFPSLNLEGRSQDSIDALYEVASTQLQKDPEGLDALKRKSTDAAPAPAPKAMKSARERMLEELAKMAEAPIVAE